MAEEKILTIPKEEAAFDQTSYVDPNGRVFFWNGRVFRVINEDQKEFFEGLLSAHVFQQLIRDGSVVGTQISPLRLSDGRILLEHEKIPFRTYCVEWPGEMLKQAALLTLDIAQALSGHDLTLQDAYPWNVYFKGTKPVFIDVGSIIRQDPRFVWKAYDQFARFFLYPLHLYALGRGRIVRRLLMDYFDGISDETFLDTISFSQKFFRPRTFFKTTLPYIVSKALDRVDSQWKKKCENLQKDAKIDRKKISGRFFDMLRKEIVSLKVKDENSYWRGYYDEKFSQRECGKDSLLHKEKVLTEILDKCRPGSLLDMGGNTGRFSVLAAKRGISVIATDKYENCVNQIYRAAKNEGLNITPLVMDFINPTPSFGWCSKQFPSATSRIKCDMVLGLALIHHLVFKQWQDLPRIMETFAAFSNKWAVVEFIPVDDEFIRSCWEDRFSFYTLDNLVNAAKVYFADISIHESSPQGRKLLLCEKKL